VFIPVEMALVVYVVDIVASNEGLRNCSVTGTALPSACRQFGMVAIFSSKMEEKEVVGAS
jgi:hypothetical protein